MSNVIVENIIFGLDNIPTWDGGTNKATIHASSILILDAIHTWYWIENRLYQVTNFLFPIDYGPHSLIFYPSLKIILLVHSESKIYLTKQYEVFQGLGRRYCEQYLVLMHQLFLFCFSYCLSRNDFICLGLGMDIGIWKFCLIITILLLLYEQGGSSDKLYDSVHSQART